MKLSVIRKIPQTMLKTLMKLFFIIFSDKKCISNRYHSKAANTLSNHKISCKFPVKFTQAIRIPPICLSPTSFSTETNVYVLSALSIKKINEKIHLTTQYHQHRTTTKKREEKKRHKHLFYSSFPSFSGLNRQLTDDEKWVKRANENRAYV